MAGLIANDYFDLEEDRLNRPGRPLAAGTVAPKRALKAALALAGLGVMAAGLAGKTAGLTAILLIMAITFYDVWGKAYLLWGPVNMGLCRGLSLLLGASAVNREDVSMTVTPIIAACGLTLYIAAVTHIAAKETEDAVIGAARWFPFVIILLWFPFLYKGLRPVNITAQSLSALLALSALAWSAHCASLMTNPGKTTTPQAVGALIKGLLLIQAALCVLAIKPGLIASLSLLAGWPIFTVLGKHFYAS